MTTHSPSSESPAARGTTYSAARIEVEGGFRTHRGGSVHRRASDGAAAGAGLAVAAAERAGVDDTAEGVELGPGPGAGSGVREQLVDARRASSGSSARDAMRNIRRLGMGQAL
jgi:hypothetical protein